ncbi:nudix hydrolase mitochondrial-like [Micractinium conductrix]|uniref:Nudix hydrolase mitochondrial-like n=1 Tax=Micractinium conductrix TaxID=554055 RepID=A0A2P6VRH2_9CHLO|nr:nudix hydrolase mitochondrial-like [Micractinium conductrix]|eukprot:PSC76670.1 nudix hydrolase mitochondrial-like [Micractinium conductrix]
MPHRVGAPVPTASRTGRHNQKYGEGGERLVAGSIPVRFKPGVAGPDGVEVLLISSRRGHTQYVFPKGGWEVDEELREAALRETVEEAGVRGDLQEPIIGKFAFASGKADAAATSHGGRCIAYLFALHVTEELPTWPEAHQRTRHWCSLQEACARCRYDWMREALVAWITSRGWDAAAAACRACAPAATATPQQASQPAPVAQQHQQQAPCPAPSPPQPVPQQAAAQQTLACAAVMATGQAPAEASVPSPVERIAVST